MTQAPGIPAEEDDTMDASIKEKQISVDPSSLNIQPPKAADKTPTSSLPPLPFLAPPMKSSFISSSLPSSASSSPLSPSALVKNFKKWRHQCPPSPLALRRSKSCSEGRAFGRQSDDFELDLTLSRELEVEGDAGDSAGENEQSEWSKVSSGIQEKDFKCGALCLFLPNFTTTTRAKQVKLASKREERAVAPPPCEMSISRSVSLEKFECGSWASPAIPDEEEGEGMNLYFDLPLELIRGGGNEMHSPVASAFVFERDRKGVLKKKKSTDRRSHESSSSGRHVRFSASPPTAYPSPSPSPSPSFCISPRLRKAREEFNAYLEEAQRA